MFCREVKEIFWVVGTLYKRVAYLTDGETVMKQLRDRGSHADKVQCDSRRGVNLESELKGSNDN